MKGQLRGSPRACESHRDRPLRGNPITTPRRSLHRRVPHDREGAKSPVAGSASPEPPSARPAEALAGRPSARPSPRLVKLRREARGRAGRLARGLPRQGWRSRPLRPPSSPSAAGQAPVGRPRNEAPRATRECALQPATLRPVATLLRAPTSAPKPDRQRGFGWELAVQASRVRGAFSAPDEGLALHCGSR